MLAAQGFQSIASVIRPVKHLLPHWLPNEEAFAVQKAWKPALVQFDDGMVQAFLSISHWGAGSKEWVAAYTRLSQKTLDRER